MATHDAVARAYDAIAPEYQAHLEQNLVAGYMRRRLHAHLAGTFHSGNSVLDFTAGTGIDACFLKARGTHVTALDASPVMIAEFKRTMPDLDARVWPAERMGELRLREFDGAFSTFGGLNTIQDLPRLAHDLNDCLKPSGRLILHALNDWCLWQRTRRGTRELHVGQTFVLHRFYEPFELWRQVFASYFDLFQVYALSVVAAPSLTRRFPRAAPWLFALDAVAGRVWPAAGDFFVMELVKR